MNLQDTIGHWWILCWQTVWFSDSTQFIDLEQMQQFEESLSPMAQVGPPNRWQLQGSHDRHVPQGSPVGVTREKGWYQCRVLAAIHWVLPLIPSWFECQNERQFVSRPFDLANWETPIHVTTFEIFTCFAYLCFAMSRMWRFASLRRLSFAVGLSLVACDACDACEPIAADGEKERDFMHLLQRFSHRTARCGLSLLMFITHRGTELLRYWMILIHCRAF